MKVLIVSSVGGHLEEVRGVVSHLEECEPVWVLNDVLLTNRGLSGRLYEIAHAERDWRLFLNLWEVWKIVCAERPDLMLSAGAGLAVPAAVVCRVFGIPIVFVESISQVDRPSLTGRLMYFLATKFFFQWPELAKVFPRGEFVGALL